MLLRTPTTVQCSVCTRFEICFYIQQILFCKRPGYDVMVRPGYDVMVAGLQGPGYDVMVAGLQGITNQGCSRPPYNLLCKAPTLTPCHSRVGKWGLETAACITGVGGGLLRVIPRAIAIACG